MMAFEADKEESKRCIQLGLMCLHEGLRDKALKLFNKAEKLHSSHRARELIRQLERTSKSRNGTATTANGYGAFDHYEQSKEPRNRFHSSNNTHPGSKLSESPKPSQDAEKTSKLNNHDNNNSDACSDKNVFSPKVPREPTSTRDRSRSRVRSAKTSGRGASPAANLGSRATSAPQLGVDYTLEQQETVQRIRYCKDFYEILDVQKDFRDDDLKKQYRKLALRVHPDKNQAPGAAEAFKAVGNAYAVLSDPSKRQRYDMYCENQSGCSGHRRRASFFYEYDYNRGFEDDMAADDIFNMFFGGGGFHTGNMGRRGTRSGDGGRNENNYGVLFQLMPLFVLVLLSVVGQFFIADPVFSLQRDDKYSSQRTTRDMHMIYYVKPDFLKHYRSSVHRIEKLVEEEYINKLRTNCFSERSHKETMLWRARTYGDTVLYEKAHGLATPSCDRLSTIYA